MPLRREKSKTGQTRSQNSIMLEGREAFISSIRKMEKIKKTIKKREEKVGSFDGGGNALQERNKEALQLSGH